MTREIPLTQGKCTLVDDDDYDLVSVYKWSADRRGKNWYARAWDGVAKKIIYLHRCIMGFPDSEVDHKNRGGLDNRRCNLRLATRSGQAANRTISRNNTSGYRGVAFNKRRGKWMAYVEVGGKRKYLGADFLTAEEASIARDAAAAELHGEFAALNSEET